MRRNGIQRGSPADWLQHARSDLCLAQSRPANENILPETLCFHAQQAVEKALKAALVSLNVEFPNTHNIRSLVELLPVSVFKDPILENAAALTDYAVNSRYPGESEPVSEDEFQEAVELAEGVVAWAESMIGA